MTILLRRDSSIPFASPPRPGTEPPTPPPSDPPATDPTPDLPKPTDPRPEPNDPEFPEPQMTARGKAVVMSLGDLRPAAGT